MSPEQSPSTKSRTQESSQPENPLLELRDVIDQYIGTVRGSIDALVHGETPLPALAKRLSRATDEHATELKDLLSPERRGSSLLVLAARIVAKQEFFRERFVDPFLHPDALPVITLTEALIASDLAGEFTSLYQCRDKRSNHFLGCDTGQVFATLSSYTWERTIWLVDRSNKTDSFQLNVKAETLEAFSRLGLLRDLGAWTPCGHLTHTGVFEPPGAKSWREYRLDDLSDHVWDCLLRLEYQTGVS